MSLLQFYHKSYNRDSFSMEESKELISKFLKAVDGDSPLTKLWKYRALIHVYPQEASLLKEKMLEFAIKNRLIGSY